MTAGATSFASLEADLADQAVETFANATLIVVNSAGETVFDVVFDAAYAEAMDIAGTAPSAACKSADVTAAGIVFDSLVDIGGDHYRVVNIRPDGVGVTRLILESA